MRQNKERKQTKQKESNLSGSIYEKEELGHEGERGCGHDYKDSPRIMSLKQRLPKGTTEGVLQINLQKRIPDGL